MPKKSGQTALILVVVTMVTVLGIGVASSTQANIDLRDTVYSTQSEQALGCAEAGAELAMGKITAKDPNGNGITQPELTDINNSSTATLDSCSYDFDILFTPETTGPNANKITIPKLRENSVQELRYTGTNADPDLQFNVTPLNNLDKASLAIYVYSPGQSPEVTRSFYFVGDDDVNRPTDFASETDRIFTLAVNANSDYIRIRPLYADMSITITNFKGPTGYFIKSTGTAGVVKRVVEAYRYYSQLPAAFDEAVVMFEESP